MSETRALLLTDVVDSTKLSTELGDALMAEVWAAHDRVARDLLPAYRGREIDKTDGMLLLFASAADAVGYALSYHRSLSSLPTPMKARAGLHVGAVILRENSAADVARGAKPLEVEGLAKPTASRVMSLARGGQTLLTREARDALGETPLRVQSHGHWVMKGVAAPEELFEVGEPGAPFAAPADTEKVYRVVRAGDRWLPVTQIPNNLPQQLTSFVGRGQELDEIKALLLHSPLLTLVGMGGMGKTRLSLQVAAEVIAEYPDGVWFLDLAPMRDPALVVSEAARVLGVREEPDKPLLRTLCAHLKSRRMLLILDNCEHLVEPAAQLADAILRDAPPVRILASSREALRVPGEQHYPVLPLRVPNPGEGIGARSRSAVEQYEGVRLFVDRAKAAQPAFKVTDQTAAAVTRICQQLDGVPLAIELAAARVQALSVEYIATHLNDRFHLLAIGDRTAMPRWRTLRALIDWSYDLLTEPERVLFRRLAVFAGGWSLEAVEAVGAGGGIHHDDVLDLLIGLVAKSLVIAEKDGTRYRLLETVRQYAAERLDESGESEAVRKQHLDFYREMAEGARPGLGGPEHARWLELLDVEQQNLLSAHAWCDHAKDGGDHGLKFVYGLMPYFVSRGMLALGRRVTLDALARVGAQTRGLARSRALHAAGWLCCYMGRYREAQNHLEESQAIACEMDDQRRIAAALQPLSMALLGQGDLVSARRHAEEALAMEQQFGDSHQIASALNLLAQIHRLEGNLDSAEPLYEKVVALAQQQGEREVVALGLLNIAMVLIGRGLTARAAATLLEVIAITEQTGSQPAGQSVLEVSAGLAARLGDWQRAAWLFGAAEAQAKQSGLQRDPADEAFVNALMTKARRALGDAIFESHQLAGTMVPCTDAISQAHRWLDRQRTDGSPD